MLFKLTGQAFLIPASLLALGFFILYASTRLENRMETRIIKLYGFFTVSLLWMCSIFLILGGIFEDTTAASMPAERSLPGAGAPPGEGMPAPAPHAPPGSVPNGDEEMSLNPDENLTGTSRYHRQETFRRENRALHGRSRTPSPSLC